MLYLFSFENSTHRKLYETHILTEDEGGLESLRKGCDLFQYMWEINCTFKLLQRFFLSFESQDFSG